MREMRSVLVVREFRKGQWGSHDQQNKPSKAVVPYVFNLVVRSYRQAEGCEFKAILVYVVTSRISGPTQ